MALFLLTLSKGSMLFNGVNQMLVSAEDLVDAKALALGNVTGYPKGYWSKATIGTAIAAKADYEGVAMRIRVYSPAGVLIADATSAIGASSETVDGLCAKMVTALNATVIDNAAYATPNLTVASGSGGDDLGDHRIVATLIPASGDGGEYTDGDDALRSVVAIFNVTTDEGVSTDALAISMVVSAAAPKIHTIFGDQEN